MSHISVYLPYALNCQAEYVVLLFFFFKFVASSLYQEKDKKTLIRLHLEAFNHFYLLSLT